ncbi:MAG: hypothetical protein K6B67_09185 [Lachnospiraceae bacterium]|nr:hypothetical protein [Lachnospiraceae bacterium]
MKKKFLSIFLIILCLMCFNACGNPKSETQQSAQTTEKENKYIFSGYYISDDKTTIANYVVYCYTDGSLKLDADSPATGSWEKSDNSLKLLIGDKTYTAKASTDGQYYDFILKTQMGNVPLSIEMRCDSKNTQGVFTEANRIEGYKDEVDELTQKYKDVTGGIILYGGSNFKKWITVEDDLSNYTIINKSFGGSSDTTRSFYADQLLYHSSPDMVILMSSTNDWTSGNNLEQVKKIKADFYDDIAKNLPDTKIVIMSATPNPLRYYGEYHDGMVACDKWLAEYCNQHKNFYFADCRPALSLENGDKPDPTIWGEDNLHLNEIGYQKLSRFLNDEIARIMAE